jgi:hypothetical protein
LIFKAYKVTGARYGVAFFFDELAGVPQSHVRQIPVRRDVESLFEEAQEVVAG